MDRLTKEGEIDRVEDKGYSRIYPAGTDANDRILLSLVRRKTDHKILSCFLTENGASQQHLIDFTGLSKSTVSEHLATLLELGVVRPRSGDDGRVFELTDPAMIDRLLRRYPVLLEKATGRFIDLWDF